MIWAPMVIHGFSDDDNKDITVLGEYNGLIYAGVTNQVNGAQIWRSYNGDNNSWTKVAPAEPGMDVSSVTGFAVFGGELYATIESESPAQIWRSYGGGSNTWTTIMSDGFGNNLTTSVGGMAEFGGYLYVGAGNTEDGALLYRTNDAVTWEPAIQPGFGDPSNQKVEMVFVFRNQLYVSVKNTTKGMALWRSSNGLVWEQVNQDGFGDSHNTSTNWNNAATHFLRHFYVGTSNILDGGELWRMLEQFVYLPLILH